MFALFCMMYITLSAIFWNEKDVDDIPEGNMFMFFFLHTGSWHIRNFWDKIFCYFGLDFFGDDHLKNGPSCVLSLKLVSLQNLLQCTCFQNLEWITYPTTGSNFAPFKYIGSFLKFHYQKCNVWRLSIYIPFIWKT